MAFCPSSSCLDPIRTMRLATFDASLVGAYAPAALPRRRDPTIWLNSDWLERTDVHTFGLCQIVGPQ
jgi:hypothetical protein